MLAAAATFVTSYQIFGPVRMGVPDQCHPQPTGEVVCTRMWLPDRPESLLGITHSWWVPVLARVVAAAVVALWRWRRAGTLPEKSLVDLVVTR